MFSVKKYRKYFVLGFLTVTVTLTPVMVRAVDSNSANSGYQVAPPTSTHNNTSDEAQIKKALLADATEQNWQPKIGAITIADGYALATTYDENTGGESVLKKQQGVWKIVGGTGGAFSKPEELVQIAKVPLPTARRLLKLRASQQR